MRSTSRLYHWDLAETPVDQVVKRIEALPPHLRPWAGRLVWWDRYAERTEPVQGFEGWLQDRTTPEPNPVELAQALVGLGYTPDYAGLRAGEQDWGIAASKKIGRPQGDNRHAPEGTQFPLTLHPRVVMLSSRRPDRNRATMYTVHVKFPQSKTVRRAPIRKGFACYFRAMDYALDAIKKLTGGEAE
jgi:hypothetical protein